MRQIHHGVITIIHGVEDVISEQLDIVAITRLTPTGVVIELRALGDKAQFCHQPHKAAILQFLPQLLLQTIVVVEGRVEILEDIRRDALGELIRGLHSAGEKGAQRVVEGGGIVFRHELKRLRVVLEGVGVAACKGEDDAAEGDEVFLLELGEGPGLGAKDIEHAAAVEADTHLAGDEDLGEFEAPRSKAGVVDSFEGVGKLDDVGPHDVLGDHLVGVDRGCAEVLFCQGLGEGVVVVDEDDGWGCQYGAVLSEGL